MDCSEDEHRVTEQVSIKESFNLPCEINNIENKIFSMILDFKSKSQLSESLLNELI